MCKQNGSGLLSNWREVQGTVCSHLHHLFIADPGLAKLVHFQVTHLSSRAVGIRNSSITGPPAHSVRGANIVLLYGVCRHLSSSVALHSWPAGSFTHAGQAMTSCRLQSNNSSTVTLHGGPVLLRPIRATPVSTNKLSAYILYCVLCFFGLSICHIYSFVYLSICLDRSCYNDILWMARANLMKFTPNIH